MESKTLQQAHPDTTTEDILAENPELHRQVEEKRLAKEHEGRIYSQFRRKQSDLAEKEGQLGSFLQLLDGINGIDLPSVLMANTKNSPAGLLSISQMAGNFAGAFIVKSCAPKLRQMATKEVDDLKKDFEKFVADNRDVLHRLELI